MNETPATDLGPETGDRRVDTALTRVRDAAGRAPADQLPVYEDAHRALTDALANLDEDPGG